MPGRIEDAGDFLADVRALEAAGAEMIGLDGDGPEQWTILGAIAATTERVRLRTTGAEPGALRTLSRGRAVVGAPDGEQAQVGRVADPSVAGTAGQQPGDRISSNVDRVS